MAGEANALGGKALATTISSDAGRMGESREAVLSRCKAGVIGLSKGLARELGHYGMSINVACPGAIIPEGRDVVGSDGMATEEAVKVFPRMLNGGGMCWQPRCLPSFRPFWLRHQADH